MKRNSTLIWIFPSAILAIFSLILYGAVWYKGFDSDLAIHVLMTEHLRLPFDLYYWGQDRLGSVIPLVGSVFHLLGVKSLWATTLAQYSLLAASFYFLQSLLKNPWSKILLAILIFFPHSTFQVQVLIGHPYVGQLFFVSLFIYLWAGSNSPSTGRLAAIALTAILALWASEISIANLMAFVLVYWRPALQQLNNTKKFIAVSISILAGVAFILMAKNNAASEVRYLSFFASPSEVWTAVENLLAMLQEVALFSGNKPPNQLLFYAFVLLVISIFIRPKKPAALVQFFFISSVLSFVLVLFSKWSALNEFPLRYYTPAYLQLLLAVLFHADYRPDTRKFIVPTLGLVCLLTAWSGLFLLQHFNFKVDQRLHRKEALTISKMGDFGLIGSYWNTYPVDAFSADIKATPHHATYVRNHRLARHVFAKDSIMIIRNEFLEQFPDTLQQFGHTLIKKGPAGNLNEFEWAFYRPLEQQP